MFPIFRTQIEAALMTVLLLIGLMMVATWPSTPVAAQPTVARTTDPYPAIGQLVTVYVGKPVPLPGGCCASDGLRAGLITRLYVPGPHPEMPEIAVTAWRYDGVIEFYDHLNSCQTVITQPCFYTP